MKYIMMMIKQNSTFLFHFSHIFLYISQKREHIIVIMIITIILNLFLVKKKKKKKTSYFFPVCPPSLVKCAYILWLNRFGERLGQDKTVKRENESTFKWMNKIKPFSIPTMHTFTSHYSLHTLLGKKHVHLTLKCLESFWGEGNSVQCSWQRSCKWKKNT